jgi:hypothetical protein
MRIMLAAAFSLAATAALAQAAPPAAGAAPGAGGGAPAAGAPPAGGAAGAAPAQPQQPMRFFVTSTVPGHGNLGGLAGADMICQNLAQAAGAGNRTWRAYLSTQAAGGQQAVNARDRIGNGPWHNQKGVLIANNVDELHGDTERDRNYIVAFTAIDEKGNEIPRNKHDILTGSTSTGRAHPAGMDMTCGNWTNNTAMGRAMLGHHDRTGLPGGGNTSWNAAHQSAGCDAASLTRTGGGGLMYCFATN